MNHEDVCRTAPATPGLLNMISIQVKTPDKTLAMGLVRQQDINLNWDNNCIGGPDQKTVPPPLDSMMKP